MDLFCRVKYVKFGIGTSDNQPLGDRIGTSWYQNGHQYQYELINTNSYISYTMKQVGQYQFLPKKWSTIIIAALVTQAAPKQSCEDVSVCLKRSEELNKLSRRDGEAAFIKIVPWDFQYDFLYPTIL